MNFTEAFLKALADLSRHKLRTALTMLGMIFGVGAVIAMLSIGAGGEQQALDAISRLGLDNVIVRATEIDQEKREEIRKTSLGVSARDGEAIQQAVEQVTNVLPRVEIDVWRLGGDTGRTDGKVFGTSSGFTRNAGVDLAEGRYLDELDQTSHAQVAIIGSAISRDLFGDDSPIGEMIKINDLWFEIVGVTGGDTPAAELEGIPVTSPAREIVIPVSTAIRKFERDPLDSPLDEIIVQLEPGTSTREVAETIEPLLDRLHGGVNDYEIVVPEALLEQRRQTQRIFNIVMGSIAGISLLVGGIGIMNIMLATVLERTREIGLRRAIGATRDDIRRQFVIESFTISFLGGVIGILAGIIIARLVAAWAGWPTVIEVSAVVLATAVSITVGLVSGIYPATRAAKLDPIEALRYE